MCCLCALCQMCDLRIDSIACLFIPLPISFIDFFVLFIYLLLLFLFFLPFLGPLLWHMEIPRLGVESEL